MSDVTSKNIKVKELGITNFHINVYIPHLSILPNLSFVNYTK